MTLRLYYNPQHKSRPEEHLPWEIHCEETGKTVNARSVMGIIPHSTEVSSEFPILSRFVVKYENAKIAMKGDQAIISWE